MRAVLHNRGGTGVPPASGLAGQHGPDDWMGLRAGLLRLWASSKLAVLPERDDMRLIREEDYTSWGVFAVVFIVLVVFDNMVLHRHEEDISFRKAMVVSIFWLACAGLFCIYVGLSRGKDDAFDWATGYLLEWMLSVDNLFVFRSIFMAFKTPDAQKHKPLFWGIVGAVFFRMAFFVVEEFLVHAFSWMYLLLGLFLIYTGIKVVLVSDDDEVSPGDSPVFNSIIAYVPYVDKYSRRARFFDWVPIKPWQTPRTSVGPTPRTSRVSSRATTQPSSRSETQPPSRGESFITHIDSEDILAAEAEETGRYRLVATRLTLVVICLELTDVVFAVDSVSAIVAQIPDLFLAYTACVFAMLGLRATFFVVDELVKLFTLLPYAVAAILILIGTKLMLRSWVHVTPEVVCATLFSILLLSILGSIVYDRLHGKTGCEACGGERREKTSQEGEGKTVPGGVRSIGGTTGRLTPTAEEPKEEEHEPDPAPEPVPG